MLQSLKLVGVGPAPEMEMHFAPRLNVLTGDNGLGKSLFLETIWYVLTGSWAGMPAWPRNDADVAEIKFSMNEGDEETQLFLRQFQRWTDIEPMISDEYIVVYARVDGSIAIWDQARRSPAKSATQKDDVFTPDEILHDKRDDRGQRICRGLIEDWVTWQDRRPESPGGNLFAHFCAMLETLSPNPGNTEHDETIRPAKPIRLFVNDSRDFPTIDVGYGATPIIHASAGMRRIISLAYLVLWAWNEHVQASRLLKQEPAKKIVFLMDEVENHLHPEWQRRILPALLKVFESLGEGMQVQMHVTTHSPMVLASLEPHWKNELDQLFLFALENGKVVLQVRRTDCARAMPLEVAHIESISSRSGRDLSKPRKPWKTRARSCAARGTQILQNPRRNR
jgi:hypothetical protein